MCGIAGFVNKDKSKASEVTIRKLTTSLAHRGPEGEGIILHENVAIGHRRLSFIDIAGGGQPLSNENESMWVTFNGEIYNYMELREQLIRLGHKFKTKSDTEVIVHAYEEWDQDCVKKFRGMFAFAILDKANRCIFLARDHFGIKPLLIYQNKDTFAFASEIQAFKEIPDIELTIDLKSIDQYLWFQYIPAPNSVFKEVRKLMPASTMTISFEGRILKESTYWVADFKPDYTKSEDDFISELDSTLKDSVKAHLVSEVPFGAFLSGGIDSTLVVKYMSEVMNSPVKTFNISFNEEDFSEEKYAQIVATRYNTEHTSVRVTPKAIEILPELVKHYGEPFGDSSAIPTYYVSKITREKVTMSLSGDGADELFGGYESYSHWIKKDLNLKLSLLDKLMQKGRLGLSDWISCIQYMDNPSRLSLWKDEAKENLQPENLEFTALFRKTSKFTILNKAQFMDINTYLPFDILTKVDITSMMSSLEVRTPFIDTKVYELGLTIPEKLNYQIKDGQFSGKLLLKKILAKDFDDSFVNRKKRGFATPLAKWFSKDGQLDEYLQERILNRNALVNHLFNSETIKYIFDNKITGILWLLVFLEEWLQQNKSYIRFK